MKAKNCKDDAAKAAFLRRVAALDEMEEGEQARREIKEKRWKLEEERRRNLLNERRIRKLEDELRRLKGGRLSG
ncbi:MAG: hypothetical protein Q4G55_08755 [bacterium]|nr:hypothetical protein [bacterium]